MSLQSIVPYHLNGEQYFTHTSWFSEKQYNAWNNIPIENHNLAIYSGLSTVAVIGIFFRKRLTFFNSYRNIFTGFGVAATAGYLGWLALLKTTETSEIDRVVSKNECGSTPLWRKETAVVNLREKDYKTFMARREGRKYSANDVKAHQPDVVLLGGQGNNSVQNVA